MDPLELAKRFHETYERLAPSFGYETRKETRAFDPDSPNGKLMIAVCAELSAPPTEVVEPVAMDSEWVIKGCRETWAAAGYDDGERAAERFRGGLYQAWACGWQEARLSLVGSGIYRELPASSGVVEKIMGVIHEHDGEFRHLRSGEDMESYEIEAYNDLRSRLSAALSAQGEQPAIEPAQDSLPHPESHCHRCKGPNVNWYAPSPLFNAVIRREGEERWNEIICPTCFVLLAKERGVADGFRIDATDLLMELPMTFDATIWNASTDMWEEALPA